MAMGSAKAQQQPFLAASMQVRTSKASETVQAFYQCYNNGDVDGIMSLIAEDGAYHDMIYSEPFRGHMEIRAFFNKVHLLFRVVWSISSTCAQVSC